MHGMVVFADTLIELNEAHSSKAEDPIAVALPRLIEAREV
jgi:hypothetical protein